MSLVETEHVLIDLHAKIQLWVTETASHSGAALGSMWFTLHTGEDLGVIFDGASSHIICFCSRAHLRFSLCLAPQSSVPVLAQEHRTFNENPSSCKDGSSQASKTFATSLPSAYAPSSKTPNSVTFVPPSKNPNSVTFVLLQPPQKHTRHSSSTITDHLAWITVKSTISTFICYLYWGEGCTSKFWKLLYDFNNILQILLPVFHVSELRIIPAELYLVESYKTIIFKLERVKCGR